ncbi:hypothetical protein D3C80_128170 [compost metagenome]
MIKEYCSFSEKQVLILIYMAEGFQASARSYPDFPWGSVAFRQSWFINAALPVLESAARMAGKVETPDMLAAAAVLGGAIAKCVRNNDGLPVFTVLSEMARDAVGCETDE